MDLSAVTTTTFHLPQPSKPDSLSHKHIHGLNQSKHIFPKGVKQTVKCRTTSTATTAIPDPGIQFHEKLMYLESLNIDALKAVQKNPDFRSTPLSSLKSVENCLSSMGILRSEFGRIFEMYPKLLTSDPHLDLYPVFEFLLSEVEVPFRDIAKTINRCPRLLVCNVEEQLRPSLFFLRNLGFTGRNSVSCQTTVLLVSSVENTLIPKLQYLQDLGFSRFEVRGMVVRSPALLTYSIEKNFRPKMEFFLDEMKRDFGEIKRFPQYFSFSLDGRIRPRHRLLVEQGVNMSLSEMLKTSDGEFNLRLLDRRLQYAEKRNASEESVR